jgi:putative spermidine/putrescine transport system ATP-binding protein
MLRANTAGTLYFGDHVRVRFRLHEQESGFVKLPLDEAGLSERPVGEALTLRFHERHVRIFA